MAGSESALGGLRAGHWLFILDVLAFAAYRLGPGQTVWEGKSMATFFQELNSLARQRHVSELANASWWSGSRTRRLCALSMYVRFPEEPFPCPIVYDTFDNVTTNDRVEAYIAACQEVYEGLPRDGLQRSLLDSLEPSPDIIKSTNATDPQIHGAYLNDEYGSGMKKGREMVFQALPDFSASLKPMDEFLRTHPDAKELAELGFRPVKEEWIRGSEVADALVAGKVALFDATELLPRSLFNKSMVDIARMHGDLADSIPAYNDHGASKGPDGYMSLKSFAEAQERALSSGVDLRSFFNFHRLVDHVLGSCLEIPRGLFWKALDLVGLGLHRWPICRMRLEPKKATINTRRLPKLPKFDMLQALGSPRWVERVQNLLWTGPGTWNWHFDEEDNLLISLNGDMWVFVAVNQSLTDPITAKMRMPETAFGEARLLAGLTRDFFQDEGMMRWFKHLPFIFVKLEPGMAVTVPSMTVHTILTPDATRVLMNAFMVPKFKAPERITPHSWYRADAQQDTYLAMRSLKFSTLGHLWDTRGIGGFFTGTKLELL